MVNFEIRLQIKKQYKYFRDYLTHYFLTSLLSLYLSKLYILKKCKRFVTAHLLDELSWGTLVNPAFLLFRNPKYKTLSFNFFLNIHASKSSTYI